MPVALFVMSGMKRNFADPGATFWQGVDSMNFVGRWATEVACRPAWYFAASAGWRVEVFDELVAADVLLQVGAQHVEQRDEHRELQQQRQARCQRIDFVLLVEFHQLLLLALFVLLVLLFQRVDLRSEALHLLHRLQLPESQRHEHRPHRIVSPTIAIPQLLAKMCSWMNTMISSNSVISGEKALSITFAMGGML